MALYIAVNDPFLMSMLHGVANRYHEFQPVMNMQTVSFAVLRDRNTFDVFHDEVRTARRVFRRRRTLAMFG